MADLFAGITPYIRLDSEDERQLFEDFQRQNVYVQGSYDQAADFARLAATVADLEGRSGSGSGGEGRANRLFYLALPPTVFAPVTKLIKEQVMTDR